jgi:tetratricopeptide (TPR) repeat protein
VNAEDSASESQECKFSQPQHSSVHAAYSAVLSQVQRIADLYGQLRDAQAEAMLDELTVEQTKHSGGEQHLVKSLCNIATQVDARGRPEISLKCLLKALQFPHGIDSQLYLQIGTALRDLGNFDDALNCYQHAEKLDDGSLSEKIHLAKIRLTVATGNYEAALSEYLAIPDLQMKPTELSGLGALYRKMGRPREAREQYRTCLQVDKEFHSAYAGLAEIRKQTGKPHQAIAEYNALLRRFYDLDVGSKKVYELALSHLFRLTGQYDKSERILHDLTKDFPGDRDVHLQFAKLLALRGNVDQALKHFEQAKGPSLRDLGQLVFAAASKKFDSAFVRDKLASIQPSIMPEDKGLASCVEAYELIANSNFERAQQVLREPTFVDRFVGDFANVLRFHALRKLSGEFEYKSDHCLCRVAKRSDRSLRRAMLSIASGDYNEADRLESEFLMRLVA